MKILHTVQFYHPSVGGMQEVVKQLSERLVKLGHDVTVATSHDPGRRQNIINGVKIAEFNISGNMVYGISGDVEKYRGFLLNSDFDVIANFAAQQWATDIMLPILDQIKAKKVFVPTGFSGLFDPEYQSYFESMKNWMNKYDMNVFLSNDYRDINFARRNDIGKTVLIPNGAAQDEFLVKPGLDIRKQLGISENDFLILHVGSHTGIKGHKEAIRIFARSKIKNATFLLIANSFGGGCTTSCNLKKFFFGISPARYMDNKKLIITSLSREETIAAYITADLFLFPSNIECSPLVLFECMASKTPFLTTDVGNAAEIIEWSGSGLLLPTRKNNKGESIAEIDGSVAMLENIYADSQKREIMKNSGFDAWLNRFTWEKLTKEYEKLYNKIKES